MNTGNSKVTASFSDAIWNNRKHTSFRVIVSLSTGETLPFTYVVDGSDDNDGIVSVLVRAAYHSGRIKIKEFPSDSPDPEYLFEKNKSLQKRHDLLSESDYLMMSDYPITDVQREEIKVYRQALRDITKQNGFPENIVWPEKPSILE